MSLIQGLVTPAHQISFLRITSEWNRSSGQVEVSPSPNLFQSHEKTNVVVRDGVRRGGCIGSCWGNRREGDHWGDLGVDGWIILGWISRRWDVGIWTGLGWPRIETGGGRL